jgi:hypothetical protein
MRPSRCSISRLCGRRSMVGRVMGRRPGEAGGCSSFSLFFFFRLLLRSLWTCVFLDDATCVVRFSLVRAWVLVLVDGVMCVWNLGLLEQSTGPPLTLLIIATLVHPSSFVSHRIAFAHFCKLWIRLPSVCSVLFLFSMKKLVVVRGYQ